MELVHHWLYKQELRRRIMHSCIWVWISCFLFSFVFLFFWMFSIQNHIYILPIPDYFIVLLSPKTWLVQVLMTSLLTAYIKLHFDTFKVQTKLKTTLFEALINIFKLSNLFYTAVNGMVGSIFLILATQLIDNESFSFVSSCTDGVNKESCLNERIFILILFGFSLGVFYSFKRLDDYSYVLHFTCLQSPQINSIKHKVYQNLLSSMRQSFNFLKWFLISYYILGEYIFFYTINMLGFNLITSTRVISVLCPVSTLSITWKLFIAGSFLLLGKRLSWQLFNTFLVKNYPFLLDTIFVDDCQKLLTSNLGDDQPQLVQHIAFQTLNDLVCYSAAARSKIFNVPADSSVRDRSVKWNIVADECLSRITCFNEQIKNYYYDVVNGSSRKEPKLTKKSPQEPVIQTSSLSPNLRRRALNLCSKQQDHVMSPLINEPALIYSQTNKPVQFPRLWTANSMKYSGRGPYVDQVSEINHSFREQQQQQQMTKTRALHEASSQLINRVFSSIKSFHLISFFFTKQPDRCAANIFCNFHIIRLCVRIISSLTAKSVDEDTYGVVQCRLHEVLERLLDLLVGLERNCKMPINTSSIAASSMLRRQNSLKIECISAIYRISNAFPSQLTLLQISDENRRKLQSFVDFKI